MEFAIQSKPLINPLFRLSLNLFKNPTIGFCGALDLYHPKVYEMSRLDLQYTVLSRCRRLKLINNHNVRGWDVPCMPQ